MNNRIVGCAVRTESNAAKHAGYAVHTRTRIPSHSHPNRMTGFTYVEVLVAAALIALALVPAMDALSPGLAGSSIHKDRAEDHYNLAGRLEQLLVEPYGRLNSAANAAGSPTTPTSYSDVFTYSDGGQITRNVFLSRYDGDNADGDDDPFTGTDGGLLWVRVSIAGTGMSIETLVNGDD